MVSRLTCLRCVLVAMGAVLAASTFPLPAAAIDPFVVQRVEMALAADPSDATFVPLEDVIRSSEITQSERRDLLGELARLRSQYGYPAETAEALTYQAELVGRLEGARAPELAAVYAAASDAWIAAGQPNEALATAEWALDLDRAYLECGSDALAKAYERLARALGAVGRTGEAEAATHRAQDADLRCAEVGDQARRVVLNDDTVDANEAGFARVELFYATDRARSGSEHPMDFYGSERGPMEFGVVEVTVPRDHKPGSVEAPSLLRLEWRENPERHYVISRIETLAPGRLFAEMDATLAERGSEEALVFVHGYKVTFAAGAKRAAQIAYDLNFDGIPILFSWPSHGSLFAYTRDEAVVRTSGRSLLVFLENLMARTKAKHINIIAHSMGNRALIDALELMAVRREATGERQPVFEHVVFAAPDEDADLFANMLRTARNVARRFTLYGSENDLALATSRELHGQRPRAGEGGPALLISDGLDSIDMSELGGDVLGHSYFARSASALTDVSWLFWRNDPPNERCGMDARSDSNGRSWQFNPVRCDGPVLLSALTLLKNEGAAALARLERALDRAIAAGSGDEAAEWRAIRDAAVDLIGSTDGENAN